MTNSLLEAIQNRLTQQTAEPLQLGQGQQAAGLLSTKLTGQAPAASSGVPARSSIGENAAADQYKAGLAQQQVAGQIKGEQQAQQSADQQQAAQIQKQQTEQQRISQSQQFLNQADALLQNFNREGKQLRTKQDVTDLQNIATVARLSNQKYVDSLNREAAIAGIDSDASFKESLYKTQFADAQDLFRSNVDFDKVMAADDRTFTEEMNKISVEDAYAMARKQMEQEGLRAAVGGISGVASGAIQAYGAQNTSPQAPKNN